MKTWQAILFTCIIAIVAILFLPNGFIFLIVLATSIWASVDSSKIELYKYKSGIAVKPVILLIGCLFIWIVAFPWYLSMRYKIKHGIAQLKDQYESS